MHDETARGLGYFSIALGIAELTMPQAIRRAAGIEAPDALVRGYGVREMATGVAILMSHDATPWIWGRVAGDCARHRDRRAVPARAAWRLKQQRAA